MTRQSLPRSIAHFVVLVTIGCGTNTNPEMQQLEDGPAKTGQIEEVTSMIEPEQARAALIELVQSTHNDLAIQSEIDAVKSSPAIPVTIQREKDDIRPVRPLEGSTFRIGNWYINQKALTFVVLFPNSGVRPEVDGRFEAASEGKWKAIITGQTHAMPMRR